MVIDQIEYYYKYVKGLRIFILTITKEDKCFLVDPHPKFSAFITKINYNFLTSTLPYILFALTLLYLQYIYISLYIFITFI